jgi:hypothetical protein
VRSLAGTLAAAAGGSCLGQGLLRNIPNMRPRPLNSAKRRDWSGLSFDFKHFQAVQLSSRVFGGWSW